MATDSGRCLAARATHAPHRANLRCLGLSVGIAIAVAGCNEPQRAPYHQIDDTLDVITDRETGCQYIARNISGGSAVTPRLRANGTPNCPQSNPKQEGRAAQQAPASNHGD